MIMDLQKRKELKKKLYTIIFKTDTEEGKRFDIILLNVILLSVILAAIESVVAFHARTPIPYLRVDYNHTVYYRICNPYLLQSESKKIYFFSLWNH